MIEFKNLSEGGLLITFKQEYISPFRQVDIIINPSHNILKYEFDEYHTLIANENGSLQEGVHLKLLQANPLSINITFKD